MILTLEDYKGLIDAELIKFFDEKYSCADNHEAREMISILKDYTTRGGKRIRAHLLYLSYLGLGGDNHGQVLSASLAIELLQSFFLIHDDIIDQDDMRRGGETPHKIYQKYGTREMGNSLAILCGDLAYAYANELMAKTTLEAVKVFNELSTDVIFGQKRDILGSDDEDELIRTYVMKTSTYTFYLPLKLGLVLALGDEPVKELADNLGVAFQLQDDLLDFFGEGDKPIGSDMKEGKKTIIILKAIENANEYDRDYLLESIGNDFDVEKIKNILDSTGAKKYIEELVERYYISSLELLENTNFTTKEEIKNLILKLKSRKK